MSASKPKKNREKSVIIDGKQVKNITCRKCRHRHPANLSCKDAKDLADAARETRRSSKTREPKSPTGWQILRQLIEEYAEAVVQDSWKGGGDPSDVPIIEAELSLARMKLTHQLYQMRQRYEGQSQEEDYGDSTA